MLQACLLRGNMIYAVRIKALDFLHGAYLSGLLGLVCSLILIRPSGEGPMKPIKKTSSLCPFLCYLALNGLLILTELSQAVNLVFLVATMLIFSTERDGLHHFDAIYKVEPVHLSHSCPLRHSIFIFTDPRPSQSDTFDKHITAARSEKNARI